MLLLPFCAAYAQLIAYHNTWFKTILVQFWQENFVNLACKPQKQYKTLSSAWLCACHVLSIHLGFLFRLEFGLLVKVVESKAVDTFSIPESSQFRQKSVVGQEIGNFWFFYLDFLIQIQSEQTRWLFLFVLVFLQTQCGVSEINLQ